MNHLSVALAPRYLVVILVILVVLLVLLLLTAFRSTHILAECHHSSNLPKVYWIECGGIPTSTMGFSHRP